MQCAFKCPSWCAKHGLTKPGLRGQGAIQHHSGDTSGVFEIQMHRIKPCTALVCWASWGDRKYLGGEGYDAWVSALLRSRTRQETSGIQSRGLAFYYLNPSCGKKEPSGGGKKLRLAQKIPDRAPLRCGPKNRTAQTRRSPGWS